MQICPTVHLISRSTPSPFLLVWPPSYLVWPPSFRFEREPTTGALNSQQQAVQLPIIFYPRVLQLSLHLLRRIQKSFGKTVYVGFDFDDSGF